mgnify:FL=1
MARKRMKGGRKPNGRVDRPRRGERSGEYRSRLGSNIRGVDTDSQSEQHSGVEGSCPLDVAPGGHSKSRYCPGGHFALIPRRELPATRQDGPVWPSGQLRVILDDVGSPGGVA